MSEERATKNPATQQSVAGEGEPQGEWPESLPDQIRRQPRAAGRWLYRTRGNWAVPAWFLACAGVALMWLPLMFVFPQLAPTPLELQLLGLISGFTVELVTSSTQLIPVLAATAPGRLGPRFSVGLLGFVGLSAIWGYQAPWISLVFATVHYLIVFSVTAWLSRLDRKSVV